MTTPTPATPPAPTPEPAAQEPQSFDQAAVDRIVSERIARERGKFADYNDLKTKAAEFDKIEAQNATELDKAVKKADADARADMSGKTNTRLVRAEVKSAAAAVGFHDPTDAAALLQARFKDVPVTEDGDVDEAAVKAIVAELAATKPHLVKTDSGRPAPLPGQGQHQPPPSSGREQAKAEAAKRFGTKTS